MARHLIWGTGFDPAPIPLLFSKITYLLITPEELSFNIVELRNIHYLVVSSLETYQQTVGILIIKAVNLILGLDTNMFS